jgi:hypothetical protein
VAGKRTAELTMMRRKEKEEEEEAKRYILRYMDVPRRNRASVTVWL